MTKEEILQYNKRCAEFIGAEPCKDWLGDDGFSHESWYHTPWSNQSQDFVMTHAYCYADLKFHEDWNWIMEVVEAIEKIPSYDCGDKFGTKVIITEFSCRIKSGSYEIKSKDYSQKLYFNGYYAYGSKKEAVITAINQFLIWYNKNK